MREAEMSERGQERVRRQQERARVSRYLNAGGVLVRDPVGGDVGVRWTAASRTGADFDAGVCEALLASARLRRVRGAIAAFQDVERPRARKGRLL